MKTCSKKIMVTLGFSNNNHANMMASLAPSKEVESWAGLIS